MDKYVLYLYILFAARIAGTALSTALTNWPKRLSIGCGDIWIIVNKSDNQKFWTGLSRIEQQNVSVNNVWN